MNGVFITFEGPDGAGKTTQIRLLANMLQELGLPVITTREPGGTPIGDQIRSILLDPEHGAMADRAEVLLYAASRAQHMHEKIRPELERGRIVLCDRFVDASMAYQAAGLQLDEREVWAISQFATSGLVPQRTYMLDISVMESRRRLLGRAQGDAQGAFDRIELKGSDYHELVRQAFLKIAAAEPERVKLVNAEVDPDHIHKEIAHDCKRLLARFGH